MPVDDVTDSNVEGGKLLLATKPKNDLGLEIPSFDGGLAKDALWALPVYTGDGNEEALSSLADVDLAPTVGVQGHCLREPADARFAIPNQGIRL